MTAPIEARYIAIPTKPRLRLASTALCTVRRIELRGESKDTGTEGWEGVLIQYSTDP